MVLFIHLNNKKQSDDVEFTALHFPFGYQIEFKNHNDGETIYAK